MASVLVDDEQTMPLIAVLSELMVQVAKSMACVGSLRAGFQSARGSSRLTGGLWIFCHAALSEVEGAPLTESGSKSSTPARKSRRCRNISQEGTRVD